MIKKKKKSKFDWLKSKTALFGVAGVVGLFGSVWTLDQHWLPREIHNISIAQVQQSIGGIQKEVALQSSRNEVFYWLRRENELKALCARNPKDISVQKDLEEAIIERRRAEDNIKKLQEKK